ncbi:hypothetical protein MF672_040255 [Actinomadura sp. ATCC 31491]|uniref:SMI1/KNR4 family protein n=1 Tax=Actinomadura luzonensis TaxID=2805427 RepID=A0ABT0G5U1_9ACTN|nr:hypothetical protein [Actinomadura luzonensis]MCK2219986.1 hypothetical protein [Actinomadura luzonensis]
MSVHDVARQLPAVPVLRDRCRAMALLDAVLGPDWPCHDHDASWGPDTEMALWDNGSGDEYSIAFTPAGAYVRGFAHESPLSPWAGPERRVWPGVLDDVPEVFRDQVTEPAFHFEGVPSVTVCLWRTHGDDRWRHGEIALPAGGGPGADGADDLFALLTAPDPAEAYQKWAADHWEHPVPLAAVRHVFALAPLTEDVVRALNPDLTLADLAPALRRAGLS